ncbi:Glycosyl phosphatidyl inositol anchor synthesis [Apophysomyces sp. BC1034]|nr:Glycosyl phosphatidyl inositol anchor synthesis [Apophysomyces sp. BC1015]KAG0189212.1 Glycosyl phosphatidyl inositol anchor synthesis [Apophysomyces sp. BC1034]
MFTIGDGLRADKLFELDENNQTRAPYLRNIIQQSGTWGVSHTRVPTESRPGHVAIIAGFYEDVGAVTTGWTMNPVNFDSVFNQSQHTWSFGSPDILPMFQHGASDPTKIETFMYPPEFENFSSGLDTNGHSFRPHSKQYCDNISLVDKGVAEIVEMMEEFYGNDGRTSYVFTADHGMNNRGAHGDGHPDNTRTPLVAWGAGIRKPAKTGKGHDEFSQEWDLSEWQRDDVSQADIAPLMAHLVGIDLPVNSVGELPLEYLDADEHAKAEAAFTNAQQILEQFLVKYSEKEQNELFFRPFKPLSGVNDPSSHIARIKSLIDEQKYEQAENQSKELMALCIVGLRYFQTYDWLFLREFIIREYVVPKSVKSSLPKRPFMHMIDIAAIFAFSVLSGIVWIQKMPTLYHAYIFFPVLFWNQVVRNKESLVAAFQLAGGLGMKELVLSVLAVLLSLEALVYSFFRREVLSVCFILLAAWPLVMPAKIRKQSRSLTAGWSAACICTSIFTLLPVEKGEDITLVVCGGILGIVCGWFNLQKLQREKRVTDNLRCLIQFQLLGNLASVVLVYLTSASLQRNEGLPMINQVLNWSIIAVSSALPFVYRGSAEEDYQARLLLICMAFAPLMTLLSISYEMLFYVCFCGTALLWLELERALYKENRVSGVRCLQASDWRAVVLFMFFLNVAFFGTGNVASMASFSLGSVYRFVTIFNPFLMGTLLIAKVLIPFFVVSAVLGVLGISLNLPSFSLVLAVMSITDVQTMNFFYFVHDYGSWLEIGTTISHFCIAELFIIFTIVLSLLSKLLVGHLRLPDSTSLLDHKQSKLA